MTFTGDLLVDGTSLQTLGTIADFSGIYADGPLRGGNLVFPGIAGETYVPKVRAAYDFTVPFILRAPVGGDRAEVLDAVAALRTLCDSSASALTLTRIRPTAGGPDVEEECTAEYVTGLSPELIGFTAGRVTLVLRNLDGGWAVVP